MRGIPTTPPPEAKPATQTDVLYLSLIRTYQADHTPGTLFLNGAQECFTLELPWKANQFQVSCIPEGRYKLSKRHSQKFGHHILLHGTEPRTLILIHSGNTTADILGCILVGMAKGNLNGKPAVLSSKVAMDKLRPKVYAALDNGMEAWLTISSVSGPP